MENSERDGNTRPPDLPMDSMKSQKDITLEEEPPRSEDVQDATREGQRAIANSFRKNEEAGKAEVHQLCM